MAVVPILTEPNNMLHQPCEEITEFDKKTKKLVQNLLDTVRNAKNPIGAGLAAPQLGVLKRVCITRRFPNDYNKNDGSNIEDWVLINPVLIRQSKERELGWEGCLSLPDLYAQVERAKKITIEAYNENGEKFHLNASGFFARIIQHEMDHLDGILIIEKNVGDLLSESQYQDMFKKATSL